MSHGYYYATRKADLERCLVWVYQDAHGRQKVSCCRTNRAVTLDDFHLLGPVVDPFGTPYEDSVGG